MTNLTINYLKTGDKFVLENIIYKKLQLRRSAKSGRTNAQNLATKQKRFIADGVILTPLTEGYLNRITPIQCRYIPNQR